MKALILNSGLGSRMGALTSEHSKCMTEIDYHDTILSRQLKLIADFGIEEVVITTGYYDGVLINYCNSLQLPLHVTFIKNPKHTSPVLWSLMPAGTSMLPSISGFRSSSV